MPAPSGYSATQIALHWIAVPIIAAQFLFADAIAEAFRAAMRGVEHGPGPLVAAHVIGGLAVLALAVWRLALRFSRGAPPPPETGPRLLRRAARAGHAALYGLMILVPVSGAAAWFGGSAGAGAAHSLLRVLLLLTILGHVAAALWHRFGLRDGVMARMFRPG